MPLSAPTERKTFDSENKLPFVFCNHVLIRTHFCSIVIVEIGRNARRELGKKIREAAGAKTYLSLFLFPREKNDIKERAKRLSRCFITDLFRYDRLNLCLFIIVGSRSFPLSLFPRSLSLERAQKEERTNETKKRTRESAHMHTKRRRARARGKPNQIFKYVFLVIHV